MEAELGRPIAEVFSSISERPIAAASLGQVGVCPAAPAHVCRSVQMCECSSMYSTCLVCALSCDAYPHSPALLCNFRDGKDRCNNVVMPMAAGIQGGAARYGGGSGGEGAAAQRGARNPARPVHLSLHGAIYQPHLQGAPACPLYPPPAPLILRGLFIFRSRARFINPICKARLPGACYLRS